MTYRTTNLSGLEKYLGIDQQVDEVYVLRLRVTGAPLSSVGLALKFAAATGRAFAGGYLFGLGRMDYDVRGLVLAGQGADWLIDVICTFSGEPGQTLNYFRSAQDLASSIAVDGELRQEFPSLTVDIPGAAWLYMDGDDLAGERSYWLSAPIIYDHRLKDKGSTTQAYDLGKGVWSGAQGLRQTEWKLSEPPPIGPGPAPGPGTDKPSSSSSSIWIVAAAAAVVGWLVWRDTSDKRLQRRST